MAAPLAEGGTHIWICITEVVWDVFGRLGPESACGAVTGSQVRTRKEPRSVVARRRPYPSDCIMLVGVTAEPYR